MKKPKILDVGSGNRPYFENGADVVHMDKVKLSHTEVVHDLETFPLPFKDNEFDFIITNHVLEHIDNFFGLMAELHRILKPKGIIKIRVPHCLCVAAFTNPDHKRFFGLGTFNYFIGKGTENYYTDTRFKIIRKELNFVHYRSRWVFLNRIMNPILNLWQEFTEQVGLIRPEEIYFELEAEK